MNILQVIPNLHIGGAERFVCELSIALNRIENIHCEILSLYDLTEKDILYSTTKENNIKIHSLGKKIGRDIKMFYLIYKFIKNGKYDVVHSHIGAIKYMLLSVLLLRKVRFVATIHSDAKFESGGGLEKFIKKIIFKWNWCIPVTISEESFLSFEEFYHKSTVMIPNGVSGFKGNRDTSINKKEGEILFIHPASCQPVKNQKLLFSAFKRLKNKYRNIRLLWYGSINHNQSLFDELSSYFDEGIRYAGVHQDIRSAIVVADAICLSSKIEGLPMTIIEAFSVGKPVLSTPVGGCRNIIQNRVNGLLSKSLQENDYYDMLEEFILMTDEERKQMNNSATETFEEYKISKIAQTYVNLYKKR